MADEFANKVNDFLKSFNHLNNSEENFICDKCEANFASKEFLNIHIGATHKLKCQSCNFETGHNETMKEHVENPGINLHLAPGQLLELLTHPSTQGFFWKGE